MKEKRPPSPDGSEATAPEGGPSLPPWKAFVVQFSRQTDPAAGLFSGRVEHLSSGHRARFASPDELLAVLTKMLVDLDTL